jgi:Flp pilus assembly protein TadD
VEEAKGRIRPAINEMQKAVLFLRHQASYYTRLASLYESIGDDESAKNIRARLALNVTRP